MIKDIESTSPHPKKDASNRFIPMSDNAIIALKSWKTIQDKDKANQGIAWGRKNYLLQDYPDLVLQHRMVIRCLHQMHGNIAPRV